MAQNIGPNEWIEPRQDLFEWGGMEWRIDDSFVPGIGMSVAVMTLQPRKATPLHHHSNCGELLYVQEGEVEVYLDERRLTLGAGDSVLSPMGCVHGVSNVGTQAAKLLLSYSSGKRVYKEA